MTTGTEMPNDDETTKTMDEQLAEQGLIPASAAARRIGRTVYTVYRKLDSGELEGALVMGHRYVKISSINLYLKKTSDPAGERALKKTSAGKP